MAMSAPELALPDDVDALKAMVVAMAEKAALLEERNLHLELVNKSADERIARLTAVVKMLERLRQPVRKVADRRAERGTVCAGVR
ncbi:Transposase [Mesorhizobium loti]|nr:Transposase [Mesorhizobium loti]